MGPSSQEDLAPTRVERPEKANALIAARRRRRRLWLMAGAIVGIAVIAAVVIAVLVTRGVIRFGSSGGAEEANGGGSGSPTESGGAKPSGTSKPGGSPTSAPKPRPTGCTPKNEIPEASRGTYMDPTSWADLVDFNCTFTTELVGGLPVVGLFTDWDDSGQANSKVPALDKPWGPYPARPARGVNLGGWLSLEPFITPSLFEYPESDGVVDEYTLCKKLGPTEAARVLEQHYSTFITEKDFADIAAAGLDHVRIPFSYWAVDPIEGEPYVPYISWRYLLRGIEWARKYGIRVKLDLHGLPGSQNGWNHSGRGGDVNFLIGPDGAANAKRALAVHDKLSRFFAQPRYKNVVAFYGLANEPSKAIPQDTVIAWTTEAFNLVRSNGITATVVFSDNLLPYPAWLGKMTGHGDALMLDAHNYAIFDEALISMTHAGKISLVCGAWTDQMRASVDTTRGFGPSMVGEWSQADTDCTRHLNGVGGGSRWEGTFVSTGGKPKCPALDATCKCDLANADPSTYTEDYKTFLRTFAIAQMDAFEKSSGWFYWTWKTESAHQWSYQAGLAGRYLPALAHTRDWDCSKPVPSFGSLPEFY